MITPLRLLGLEGKPKTVSSEIFLDKFGSVNSFNPVVGLAGVIYYYNFYPFLLLLILSVYAKIILYNYNIHRTYPYRLLVFFLSYKSFILFRDGEIPIIMLDIIMFNIMIFPALIIKWRNNGQNTRRNYNL